MRRKHLFTRAWGEPKGQSLVGNIWVHFSRKVHLLRRSPPRLSPPPLPATSVSFFFVRHFWVFPLLPGALVRGAFALLPRFLLAFEKVLWWTVQCARVRPIVLRALPRPQVLPVLLRHAEAAKISHSLLRILWVPLFRPSFSSFSSFF